MSRFRCEGPFVLLPRFCPFVNLFSRITQSIDQSTMFARYSHALSYNLFRYESVCLLYSCYCYSYFFFFISASAIQCVDTVFVFVLHLFSWRRKLKTCTHNTKLFKNRLEYFVWMIWASNKRYVFCFWFTGCCCTVLIVLFSLSHTHFSSQTERYAYHSWFRNTLCVFELVLCFHREQLKYARQCAASFWSYSCFYSDVLLS